MHSFENPSSELISALYTVQGIVDGIHNAKNRSAYEQAILETIIERTTKESLDSADVRSYIHHTISVRLEAAEHFYATGQILAGDQQVVLAFVSCCKLVGLKVACIALERLNQQIYRQLHAIRYS